MDKRKSGVNIFKITGAVIATPVIILLLTIAALYVPAIQKHAVRQICRIVAEKSGHSIEIETFRLHFPLSASISNYTLTQDSDTLMQGKSLRTDISIAPLFKGEIEVNYISIDSTSIDTHSLIDGMRINGNISHLRTSIRNIKLAENCVNINRLNITDSDILLTKDCKTQEKDSTEKAIADWTIALKKANLSNINFKMNIPADTTLVTAHLGTTELLDTKAELGKMHYSIGIFTLTKSAASYDNGTEGDSIAPRKHLRFDNIALNSEDLHFSPAKFGAHIKEITLRQQPTGITIEKGSLQLDGDSTFATINKMEIKSHNGSLLKADATLPLELFQNINTRDKGNGNITLHIDKRDTRGFLTSEEYARLKTLPDSMLHLSSKIHGNALSLHIDTLYARLYTIAEVGFKGEGSNLANRTKRSFDIKFAGNTLHKNSSQQNIGGSASLYHGEYSANAALTHGNGIATAQGSYSSASSSYNANVNIDRLAVSEILPQIPLYTLTMNLALDGEGTDLYNDSTRYRLTAHIDTLHYDALHLNEINLKAYQKFSTSRIHIQSDAEPLLMQLWTETRFSPNTIDNHTIVEADKIKFKELGLSPTTMNATMQLETSLFTDGGNTYTLSARGKDIQLDYNGKRHRTDSLYLEATTKRDSTILRLQTGDLSIDGNIAASYKAILRSIENVKNLAIREYLAQDSVIDIAKYEQLLPNTDISISSGKKNLLAEYLKTNGITYKEVNFVCKLDNAKGLQSRGTLYDFEHNNQHLDTVRMVLTQDSTTIKYIAGIRSRAINEDNEKASFGAALYGTLDKEKLTANYIFRDNRDNLGMKLGATARLKKDGLLINFTPQATLFRQPFTFNKENYIYIDNKSNIQGNIELLDTTTYSGMNLYAKSDTLYKQDIAMELFNIDLQTATRMIPFAPEMSGIVNADLHYREDERGTIISSDIRSENLTYEGTLIGNETLELSYIPQSSNKHIANLTLLHNDRNIAELKGVYNSDSLNYENRGALTLTRFPLSIANAFLRKSDSTTGGYLDGDLEIDNTGERPIADGYISFDSAFADLPQFGTTLHLVDDRIELTENILKVEDFDIYAKGATPFKINGTIDLNNLANPHFNLRMRANNYEIINAKRRKGAILYGRMFVNLNSYITGKLNTLKVNGSATILGKSDVTYVLQDTPLETENNLDGLVTFTNFKDTTAIEPEMPEYNLGNISMNITLGIEEGARINADFDTERSSYLELQGEGNLNLTYTAEAGMNLTGRYRLSNGQMKYTLPIIPLKTFNIENGSSINWNGDIMNPTLDITAVERVITSVIIDDYSQAVGFDVGIKLSNTLDNMGLSFTLSAPDNAAVQNQLNSVDAETLNKYALTMLITGAYIGGENNVSVSGALSSFLDSQINNIVADAMNSTVDINVGITDLEDVATGDTYKNYSFSFTKRFWNDRLKVIIGGEVSENNNAGTNDSFINNVSLEWKISNSGNRYLRLFYDKNYESILEGEITEAGIGYVYKRKLNNLSELLIFRKREKTPNKANTGRESRQKEKNNRQ